MISRAKIPVALTIAGSDPGGGAGFQSDLKTFAALNVYGFSVITAVIAQNSANVARVEPVEPAMVVAQIETLIAERRPDAMKIGALGDARVVKAVADTIARLRLPAPVIDPVMVSSSGTRLLDTRAEKILRTTLIPLARVVTPNIPEAEVLSGIRIDGPDAMRDAARAIRAMGARVVLIKGGHPYSNSGLATSADVKRRRVGTNLHSRSPVHAPEAGSSVDLFFDGRRSIEIAAPRLPGGGAHGTGCALSAAIAAYLARGENVEMAVRHAKAFVTRALRASFVLGKGRPLLNHFAR